MVNDTNRSAPHLVASIAGVREQAAARMRASIVSGDLLPGQRLTDRKLCELTGASRTTVREAVRQLETEGLITTVPHRGPTVTVIDVAEAQEIYEFRAMLEGRVGRLFVIRASDDLVATLHQTVEEIGRAHDTRDMVGVIESSNRFYSILATGVANRPLSQTLTTIHNRLALFRFSSTRWPGRAAASMVELRGIVAAIELRDADAAEAACVRHIEAAAEMAFMMLTERARGAAVARPTRRTRGVAA